MFDDKTVLIKDSKTDKTISDNQLTFSFDKVFDSQAKQKDVYTYAAASVI